MWKLSLKVSRTVAVVEVLHCYRGGSVGEDLAEKIREDYRRGMSYRELARKYRVSFSTISSIVKGEGVSSEKERLDRLEKQAEGLTQRVAEVAQRVEELEAEGGKEKPRKPENTHLNPRSSWLLMKPWGS